MSSWPDVASAGAIAAPPSDGAADGRFVEPGAAVPGPTGTAAGAASTDSGVWIAISSGPLMRFARFVVRRRTKTLIPRTMTSRRNAAPQACSFCFSNGWRALV